jgi:hypothetical protein
MPGLERPIRTALSTLSIAVLVAAAACGLPRVSPEATTAPDPATVQGTSAVSPAAADPPPSVPFTSPIDRLIYRIAFDRCSIGGIRGAARDYGGDASDPTTVAGAYARFANPDDIPPAYQGCLDGLQGPTP